MSSGGVKFTGGSAAAIPSTSSKLRDILSAAGEYSIELWVTPLNVSQEDASIVSYSGISSNRNFMVSQTLNYYESYNRSSATDSSGSPVVSTVDAGEDFEARASLQHVVVTYDSVNGRQIYVDGVSSELADAAGGGTLNNWNEQFAVVFGKGVTLI